MKITYTSYTAVAEWKWDLPEESDDTCGICRVQFEGTCAKCKYPGEDCPIGAYHCTSPRSSLARYYADAFAVIGACTHCFHMHCISDWIASEASQGKCPMCRQVFKEKMADAPAVAAATPARGQQLPDTPARGAVRT